MNENGDTIFIERYQHDTLLYTRNFDYYQKSKFKWIATVEYTNDSTLIENPFKTKKRLGRRTIDIRYTELNINNNGWMVQFRENGSISDSVQIKNGLYTGTYKSFYDSGSRKIIANQIDDEFHGNYFEYFESGQLKFIASYSDGKLNGRCVKYSKSGEVQEESYYEFGKKIKSPY
jgi:antitoxin component YwqK of YwqJK toxin-antitoxin module